jgi:hypothetical protein
MGAVRYILAALTGAAVGCFVLVVAANMEGRPFYTLRALVTSRTAMREILAHPADRWVLPALLAVFVTGGAVTGVLLARRARPSA